MAVLNMTYFNETPFLIGCSEMLMSNAVAQLSATTPGKEAVAMDSFVRVLRQVCVCMPILLSPLDGKLVITGMPLIADSYHIGGQCRV